MENLSKDALFRIAIELDLPSLLKLCSTNKTINNKLCLQKDIWYYKLNTEFKDEFKDFNDLVNLRNIKDLYILLHDLNILKEKLGRKETLRQLYNLKSLNLSYITRIKNFHQIPKEIGVLINLQKLHLMGNDLDTVPKELGGLENLKKLSLSHNLLKTIPKEIGDLENLEKLDLTRNELKTVPKEIGKLQKLKYLFLAYNKLENLPEEIGELKDLEELYYQNNPKKYYSIGEHKSGKLRIFS